MAERSETTAAEESLHNAVPDSLALVWVWPTARVDRLQGARIGIGRDDAADIRLDGGGVSRNHAELYRQGPIYVVKDVGSTNGTWLDGRRIEHAPVAPGRVLRVGECVGVFSTRGADSIPFGEHAAGVFGGEELAILLRLLARAAPSNVPIVLVGATGTGKERFARAAHQLSGRSGSFVAVNCAALPENLAEAELFGYRRGAFTGAERASPGFFRAAHQGTLFLDEMPELTPALQAKLLRVVEDGEVLGLGEVTPTRVDVRIVSASQKPLSQLVTEGTLRDDLSARLGGLQLRLPALSARRADIAPLFMQFLSRQAGGRPPAVEARVIEALSLHDWPQNVRELELVTRTLLAVHGCEATLRRRHLPPELANLTEALASERPPAPPLERKQHDLSRVKAELAGNGGNVKAAASTLGISRQRIYRLLEGARDDERGDDGASD